MALLYRTTYHVTATQRFHHAALLDPSVWTTACASEVVLCLELPVPIKHGHRQSVHTIALKVTSILAEWYRKFLTNHFSQ